MMRLWVALLCIAFFCGTTSAVINSVERLGSVLKDEAMVLNKLRESLTDIQKEVAIVQEYIDSYGKLYEKRIDVFDLVSHPVSGYKIINRLAKGWERIKRAKDIIMEKLKEEESMLLSPPDENDLTITAMSLINLQIIYEQEARDMSEGVVLDYQNEEVYESDMKLSAEECLHIGHVAFDMDFMDIAIDWYEAALVKVEEGDEAVEEKYIWKLLDKAVEQHDNILEKHGPIGLDWRTYGIPFDLEMAKNKKYRKKMEKNNEPKLKLYQDIDDQVIDEQTHRLCRGEKMLPEEMTRNLACRHVINNDPYLMLMPLKLEEHSLDPYIAVFHDFLTDAQIEDVIKISKEQLAPSVFFTPNGSDSNTGVDRTSENSWLYDNDISIPITKKIGKATKLETLHFLSSDYYQIANYGIGGQYAAHSDYLQVTPGYYETDDAQVFGDRLATFMIYLSDVDAGGATVFPRAGVTVWPKKGSAAFWWNLYKNTEYDPNTVHSGCPVLYGSKWIANKWVYVHEQMMRRPCEVKPLRKFTKDDWDYKYST